MTEPTLNNEEQLLMRLNPDLFRIYRAVKSIERFGGNGSIEVHFVSARIKHKNGLYIKPGFDDEAFKQDVAND